VNSINNCRKLISKLIVRISTLICNLPNIYPTLSEQKLLQKNNNEANESILYLTKSYFGAVRNFTVKHLIRVSMLALVMRYIPPSKTKRKKII